MHPNGPAATLHSIVNPPPKAVGEAQNNNRTWPSLPVGRATFPIDNLPPFPKKLNK